MVDFEELFAGLPTPYLVMTPDLVIVEANRAYLELLGRTREELLGRPVFEAFPPAPDALDEEGRNPLEISFLRARETGRPDVMPQYQYDVLDPDTGELAERHWSLTSAPLLGPDGRTQLILQRVEDVSDYVRDSEGDRSDADRGQAWHRRAQAVEADLHLRMQQLRAAQEASEVATAALRASQQRAQAVLDTAVDGIITIDGDGQIESVNPAAEKMFGYAEGELVGRNIRTLMPDPHRSQHDEVLERYRRTGERRIIGSQQEVAGRRRDGSIFPMELAVSEIGSDRRLFTGIVRDITERKRLEAQLSHQALHDPLTGLANRALLVQRLELAVARRARHPGLLALLFIDLDRFKLINDTLGHDAGDELLVAAAARLRAAVRPEDLVARLGGDEFVVLCEDLAYSADAEKLAQRVAETMAASVSLRGREIYGSASVGLVTDTGERSASELLADADIAMYQAKGQGRGRYSVLDAASRAMSTDRLQLTSDLHRVLDRAELRAAYQPLVALETGGIIGAEALMRWQHPERGTLAPGAFLGLADDVGLIGDFDAWMLVTACADAAGWARQIGRSIGVWVNLSGRSLADRRLVDTVGQALERAQLAPGLLTLEITEGTLMQNAAATVRTLAQLRDLGVRLAVDDFGTGFSSLAYLQQFPVHALKVDRSFVARLDQGDEAEGSAAIIRAIASLAAGLDLLTVAEGIETPEQLAAATALGCDLGQGFFLGRPTDPQNIPLAVPDGVVLPSAFTAMAES